MINRAAMVIVPAGRMSLAQLKVKRRQHNSPETAQTGRDWIILFWTLENLSAVWAISFPVLIEVSATVWA